jgi:capsular exopolysaccharide synthesis family protein
MKPADSSNKPLLPARPGTPPDQTPVPGALTVTGAMPSAHPAAPPAVLSATPTVGALLLALKRRWPVAVPAAIVGAALALVAVYLVVPPMYVAQAQLKLQPQQSRPIVSSAGVGEPDVDPVAYRASQLGLIKSSDVVRGALNSDRIKKLGLAGQSATELSKALKADFTQGPDLLTVKLSGDDPEYLGDLLDAIVDSYVALTDGENKKQRDVVIGKLEESKRDYEKKLAAKREELAKAEHDKGVPDVVAQERLRASAQGKVQATETEVMHLRNELSFKKIELADMKARLQRIGEEPVGAGELNKAVAAAVQANSPLTSKIQPYFAGQKEIDARLLEWGPLPESDKKTEAVAQLNAQRDYYQKIIEQQLVKIRGELIKEIRADREEKLAADIAAQEKAVKRLRETEKSMTAELDRLRNEARLLEAGSTKVPSGIQKLRDDESQYVKVLDKLALDAALLKVEPAGSARVMRWGTTEAPQGKDYSRFLKIGGAAGLGVFGLVLFGVAMVEFRSRKVNGVEEVTQGLGLSLVGTMPQLPVRARRPAAGGGTRKEQYWQSLVTESVDAIRTQLLHAARADGINVVMVTSAGGGEGKTSLASQLAASLARAWRKTLLVDGDLRNPAAHKLFDQPLEPGFSEVLRGEVNLADAVKPTLLSRLWLLPAGHWDSHAVQALAQDGVGGLFEQLKEQYDFVIVDSCPVLPVADSLLLGQHVDGVIFSVLRDVSRIPAVHAARQKLENLGVRTLGAVVIGAPADVSGPNYNYAVQAGS